jgi:hypothetical protein
MFHEEREDASQSPPLLPSHPLVSLVSFDLSMVLFKFRFRVSD